MSTTIQETYTPTGDSSTPYMPAFQRFGSAGVSGINFFTVNPSTYSNTSSSNHWGIWYGAKQSTWGSGGTSVTVLGGAFLQNVATVAKVTYNVDKKLGVITGYTPEATVEDAVYTRILLILTASDYWSWRSQSGAPTSAAELVPSYTWYGLLGQNTGNARPSADGKVSLQSNPLLGFSTAQTWGQTQHRLQGSGIYVAHEDIVDPWSDCGRIISDSTGKAYICCGNRIWMDYE
jgi:hypothetical protein